MLIWCSVIESLCREFSDGVGGEYLRLLNQMRVLDQVKGSEEEVFSDHFYERAEEMLESRSLGEKQSHKQVKSSKGSTSLILGEPEPRGSVATRML